MVLQQEIPVTRTDIVRLHSYTFSSVATRLNSIKENVNNLHTFFAEFWSLVKLPKEMQFSETHIRTRKLQ